MTEVVTRLAGSAETWRTGPAEPRVPASLLPPVGGSSRARLRLLQRRNRIRLLREIRFHTAT